jgi:hypothetical protein
MAEYTDTNILFTYGDVSRKDDVLPLIEILTPKDNTLLTLLGTVSATDMVHINMTDTLKYKCQECINLLLLTWNSLTGIQGGSESTVND